MSDTETKAEPEPSPPTDRQRWYAYYTEKRITHQWFQVALLKDLPVRKVLEIGPYMGLVSAMLANAGYEVSTLDIAAELPTASAAEHIQADIRDVPSERLAGHDAIVCCETLEHIPWQEVGDVLGRIEAAAVPWLILSVPYEGFQFGFSIYVNRFTVRKHGFLKKLRFLSRFRAPKGGGWAPHKWEIGYRGHTVRAFRDMVTRAGYQIVRQEFTSGCRSIFLVCRNRGAD